MGTWYQLAVHMMRMNSTRALLNALLAPLRRSKQALVDPELAQAIVDPELNQAEEKLSALKEAYKSNKFSGHPEEMLWDIENAELAVARLRKQGSR